MNPAAPFLRAGLWSTFRDGRLRALVMMCGVAVSTACQPGLRPALGPDAAPQPLTATASRPTPRPASAPTASAPRDEVVEAAVAVFGDSTAVANADSASDEPIWDIDVRSYETHERVAHYVSLFSTTARERTISRLTRGTRYQPMIRSKLREAGMPEDLTYLAFIESGYDPHAYSRAAAVGMWQFMSSTARDVGLRVDWWMDERRDPARSTDAAIRFLGYLQKQFGSFYLAAAAYNGGPGRVARGLSRYADALEGSEGDDRFFALAEQDYLRAETKNYVPQLIAAAIVAKVPERHGLQVDSLAPYAYDSVLVAAGSNMSVVADAGAVPVDTLRDLNPAILRGVTPPDAAIWVRVPVGSGDRVRAALDALPEADRRGYSAVKVKTSKSVAALAKQHGVTSAQLRWFNPGLRTTKKGNVVVGQTVRVPMKSALAFARNVPDPGIEKYGTTVATSTSRGVHVVRRGETLGGIARRYGITESRLRSLNRIRGDRILAGQTLVVRSTNSKKR